MKNISIIIPCYNCADTLEEAVDSAYKQGLEDFEIVMVDDGSTDGTRALMERLAKDHPEIKLLFHDKNRGGGAARNTGIRNAASDILYVLDSDNILPPDTLPRMLTMLKEKKCDGIGIGASVKFVGRDVNKISYRDDFWKGDEPIEFESLFDIRGCSLYSTFMLTRKAFNATRGYPEDHGFDTQGFAFRFLGNGLTAYVCRGTNDLHRVKFHQSYYKREEASGNIPENWRKVLEEFLFLFNETTQKIILDDTIDDVFKRVFSSTSRFAPGYRSHIGKGHIEAREEMIRSASNPNPFDLHWLGSNEYRRGRFSKAAEHFLKAIQCGLTIPRTYRKLWESACSVNSISPKLMESHAYSKITFPKNIFDRLYEPQMDKLVKIAKRHLHNPISTIVEVGARDCRESIAFARFFTSADIYSFECNPDTLPECRRNSMMSSRIHLQEEAVSDTIGTTSFFKIDRAKTKTPWPDGNPGASSLLESSGKYGKETYVQQKISVPVVTLESFMEREHIGHIDILWMDIQGGELAALNGLRERIKDVSIIHTEVEFMEIYKDQPLFSDIKRHLNHNGFSLIGFTSFNKASADAVFINRSIERAWIRDITVYPYHLLLYIARRYLMRVNAIIKKITHTTKSRAGGVFKRLKK